MNSTFHKTGRVIGDGLETSAWLIVQILEPATLEVQDIGPLLVASREATFRGEGALSITPVDGELRTSEGLYVANGLPTLFEGAFSATLQPLAESRGRLDVTGNVRTSSMVPFRAPATNEAGAFPWLDLVFMVGLVLSAGVGTYAALRKRAARPMVPVARETEPKWVPLAVKEILRWERRERLRRQLAASSSPFLEVTPRSIAVYFEAMNAAEREGDTRTAYDLAHAARRALEELQSHRKGREDPHLLGGLWVEEGEYLLLLNEPRRALAAFEQGALLLRDIDPEMAAEADYGAAIAFLKAGGSKERALNYLVSALDGNADLVDEAELDRTFEPLRGAADYHLAVARARETQLARKQAGDAVER